jgi:protein-S-isoprenylcysteine O-methyltransferase Ste14
MSPPDNPGVIAPPPAIFAAALLGGWLLQRAVPISLWPAGPGARLGGLLALAGLGFAGWTLVEMRRAHTAIDPNRPSAALVCTGPFALSRNPLYLAVTVASLGVALLLAAPWCVALLVPAVMVLRRGVIAREEAYLERRFGAEYRAYCAAVPRWFALGRRNG